MTLSPDAPLGGPPDPERQEMPGEPSVDPAFADRPSAPGAREAGSNRAGRPHSATAWLPAWPPEWPEIAAAVQRAVQLGHWGRYRGPAHRQLEARLAALSGRNVCRLVSSGSLGVELALRAAGVSPGQRVVLCGYDYPGNFRAVEVMGARPLLVDASPSTYSLDPQALRQIDDTGGEVAAVVVSHLYGIPAEIQPIREICDARRWRLIEDACQTPGMNIDGRPAGQWGDAAVFSFGGSKPLTAGNGGAVVTSDDWVASKLNQWLDRPSEAAPLSELQASVLLPQLDRLQPCNAIRSETTELLLEQVRWLGRACQTRRPAAGATLYKLAFPSPRREELLEGLLAKGLPVGAGYRSMHRRSRRRCDRLGTLERSRGLGVSVALLDQSALLAEGEAREQLVSRLAAMG